jgi:RNA polymerase sigma-70 factor (ECF subfamily)
MARTRGDRSEGVVPTTTRRLLARARGGDRVALDALFGRLVPPLQRWARGRLPGWARSGADTSDIVQEALLSTLGKIEGFDAARKHGLRAYLQQAIRNRICDAVRRSGRHPIVGIEGVELVSKQSPLEDAIGEENASRYREALARLEADEQELIVGRIELGYGYEQLALATGRPSPDAARMAVKRALLRLAHVLASA